jgi:transposase
MWTPEQRRQQAVVRTKARRGYPTDVKDEVWRLIEPLLPRAARTGRPRRTDLRAVINALRYMVRAGGEWRMLPNDFPPWQTVYYWFRRLMRRMLFKTIHDLALMLDRLLAERDAAYDHRKFMDKAAFLDLTVEVVRRLEEQHGFAVQPRRWVVERTFAWLLRWRRLVRDYEQRIDVSQNMMYIAMGSMLMHRIFFR